MLVVADAKARSSPHPPLPCRRIIFTVLDHAASGAGGRRPQKEPGVEQGQPNFTLPQTSQIPKLPALPVVPALELPRQWRLWTPHTQPLDLVQHVFFLFPPQGSWFSPRGPLWHKPRLPHPTSNSQPQEQSFLYSSLFPTHSKKVARVGLTWTLLGLVPADVKSTFTCIHVQGRPRAAGCGRESSGFGEGGG